MTDDEPDDLVFDEESGIFIPRQGPATGPAESVSVMPREPARPKALMTDAEAVRRNGWGVGDVLEGADGITEERVRITAIGEQKVLGILLASRMKGKVWEFADMMQSRERMFGFLNKAWKKSEPT